MLIKGFRTPLIAAFFCAAILAGCTADQPGQEVAGTQCPAPTIHIAGVQGDAPESPILGQQVTIQGIVTLVQSSRGLYMEEPDSDANDHTSNGIFIQMADLPDGVGKGSLISVKGEVSEIGKGRYPLTAIIRVEELTQCASGQDLPLTDVALPLNGLGREALEGPHRRCVDGH